LTTKILAGWIVGGLLEFAIAAGAIVGAISQSLPRRKTNALELESRFPQMQRLGRDRPPAQGDNPLSGETGYSLFVRQLAETPCASQFASVKVLPASCRQLQAGSLRSPEFRRRKH